MLLYHYTSLEHFISIWKSKSLRFSFAKTANDFFERFKTFVLCQETFMCEGIQLDRTRFDHFDEKIRAELSKYRQVSFSLDYDDGLSGYASPMMWGQYAWAKNKEGEWQNGVCIAIDSEKIIKPPFKIYSNKISYKSEIGPPRVENIDYTIDGAADLFIERNIETYFFSKHTHWAYENEYRYVCKQEGALDISEAIIGIYLLWDNYSQQEAVESLVNDKSLIRLLALNDFKCKGEPYSLQDIDELFELMKNFHI